ncbi:MAG TPA: asparagine synthase (glutamine-hydrolyzing) [Verrucomicrobiae bacterium]|nr:asparagine synthase (glutamine-hydrolyzing) [Verrucomicrobiae bacterium]
MCGIAAIFVHDPSAPGVSEGELVAIRDYMKQRGPDGAGLWFDANRRVGLGHRRLAVIDVSAGGAQPMLLPERQLAITFNGEIYNYRELRAGLEQKGHQFRSSSDTEVLLHLYAERGEAMLDQLRGMFTFAIWDGAKQSLFIARDPFGIKPLYWADDGKTFRAASQVKALLAGGQIDTAPEPAGHVGFFLWGHVPEPYTLYRGIRNLTAGHCLTIDARGQKRLRSFCNIPGLLAKAEQQRSEVRSQNSTAQLSTLNAQPANNLLGYSLRDTIRHHLIADVPVGVFLSSGIDSTVLTALAAESGNQIRTVTLGFEEFKGTTNDETILAGEIARHYDTNHSTIWVTRKDFENDLHRLFHAMDQPSCDGVNSYFVSRAAAQAGLKVALSGLGGDELFGGYSSFHEIPRAVSRLRPFAQFPPLGRAFRAVSAPVLKHFTSPKYAGLLEYSGSYGGAYLLRRGMFMPWELPGILDADLVREGWNELQALARLEETTTGLRSPHLKVSALEMTWYMRNQLLRDTDWASMEHSLEVRAPFVDIPLLQALGPMLAAGQPTTKSDLALTPRSPLPASVLNRPKMGFVVPVRQWLRESFDPTSGVERGLRGWVREIYSTFAGNLENHQTARRRHRKISPAGVGELPLADSQSRLRVLVLLTDGFGGFGGIAKFNRDLLAALCSHEGVTEVVALPRLMPEASGPLPPKLTWVTASLGGKARYLWAVRQTARQFRADTPANVRTLIICAHIHLLPAALLARRLGRGSLHLIVHGIDAWNPTHSRLANACVRRINGFIAVSNVTKRRFMRWSRLRDDQGVVLPNCVDLSAFSPGPKSAALQDRYRLRGKKILLTLGRLASEERSKGFDEVLTALPSLLADMPDLCYLICGDGQDRPRLVAKAKALGLSVLECEPGKVESEERRAGVPDSEIRPPTSDLRVLSTGSNVIFAGRISDAEKADHYRLADVYVMPSSGEGFGIVFLEALACGIPVIGSKVDGSREALLNGRLGTLVDPRDQAEIQAAVLGALKQTGNVGSGQGIAGDSVDFFSAAQFEQRVHDIVDCIAN